MTQAQTLSTPVLDVGAALRRCAAGDRASLRAIYDQEASRMLGIAVRLLRRRDLAEEAVQDTFLKIWNSAAMFDEARGDPRAWMYTILRNRALSILRGESRTDLVDDFEPMGLEAPGENPEQAMARLSDAGALKHCLERIDPVRRQAILLAYVNGLTHGEIAGRMQIPLGTIKSWIRRSLMALKECLS
ncbi:sigma-70 family RNA polymerase sigma factor [Alsobacter sp. R-9]